MTNTIAQTAVGLERIQSILSADDAIPEKPGATAPAPFKGNIVFEHVAFGYDKDNPVLRDVNFTIKPGQIIGVVGGTGSGKSTIVSLIPRFYDPTGGRVLIDGVDVRDYQLHPLRRQIGFVLQETVLFHGTIRDKSRTVVRASRRRRRSSGGGSPMPTFIARMPSVTTR
jgi:subfamily B ATP-binding cassette protein MsbA